MPTVTHSHEDLQDMLWYLYILAHLRYTNKLANKTIGLVAEK